MTKFVLSAFSDEASDDLDGQIQALKRNKIRFMEIRNINGNSIIAYDNHSIKEIKKELDDACIQISAIGSPIGKISILDDFNPHIECFKKTLEVAHMLETKRIRIFSFFIPEGENPVQYREEVLSRLSVLLNLAENSGIYCCHENEKEIYGDTKERVVDLHQSLGMRLKGVFDPVNYIQCKEKPIDNFDDLMPYIDYLHIKDALLSDGSVVPAGYGDGGIREILNRFSKVAGTRFVTIEPHLAVFQGLSSLQKDELLHKYTYASSNEAFDEAVSAVKNILDNGGYDYE